MDLSVYGHGTLADTTRTVCGRYCTIVPPNQFAHVAWLCYDTPLTETGGDTEQVLRWISEDLPTIMPGTPILLSSQMPVGTIARLEHLYPGRPFAYVPENIRVDHAIADFEHQTRIVIGTRNPNFYHLPIYFILGHLTDNIIWTNPETAEMVKHALNAWLGMNIAFINEIARVAKALGADAETISTSLLTERRISPLAPLRPGPPFGKGHLARDLQTLQNLSHTHQLWTPLLWSILGSNRDRTLGIIAPTDEKIS